MNPLVQQEELSNGSQDCLLIKCLSCSSSTTSLIPGSMCVLIPDTSDFLELIAKIELPQKNIVLYDDGDFETAAKVWWAFKARGVFTSLLNGGLAGWRGKIILTSPEFLPIARTGEAFLNPSFFINNEEVQTLEGAFQVVNTDEEFGKLFKKNRCLKTTMQIVQFFKQVGVSLTDEKLTVAAGMYANTLVFLLSIFERSKLKVCANTDPRRTSSMNTRFFSFEESQPVLEMIKEFTLSFNQNQEDESTASCHCLLY